MARPKESEREKMKEETRQKLLAAAAEAFARDGYDRANVNRISEAAGFAIGTIYNYFPSKRDLMFGFIDESAQTHVEFITERVRQQDIPARRIETFFEAGFDFVETHKTVAWAIFNTLNGPDIEFRMRLYTAYQPLFQLLSEEILAPAIATGEFREVDLGATTGLLMIVYLGAGSQFDLEGRLWLNARQVAEFVLNSLRA